MHVKGRKIPADIKTEEVKFERPTVLCGSEEHRGCVRRIDVRQVLLR